MPTTSISKIRFFDLIQRQKAAHEELVNEIQSLEKRQDKTGLSSIEELRLKRLTALRKADPKYRDPLFVAARHQFMRSMTGSRPVRIELDLSGADSGSLEIKSSYRPSHDDLEALDKAVVAVAAENEEIATRNLEIAESQRRAAGDYAVAESNLKQAQEAVNQAAEASADARGLDLNLDAFAAAVSTAFDVAVGNMLMANQNAAVGTGGMENAAADARKRAQQHLAVVLETKGEIDKAQRAATDGQRDAEEEELAAIVALTIGLLANKGVRTPSLDAHPKHGVAPSQDHPDAAAFIEDFFPANGKAASNPELAVNVLKLIAEAVDLSSGRGHPQVSVTDFASVYEKLVEKGVRANDPNLKRRVEDALDHVQETGPDRPIHETQIDLPDLEETTDLQIIEDNVRVMGPLIYASMFDELKAFQVVDRLVESARRGELSLIKGDAGTQLYSYWRQAPNRMSDLERQTFYAMTLGIPSGQPGVTVNSEFQDLWLRFVSSVSELVRESRVEQLLRARVPASVNQQRVKKAARDLVANMSLFGYGMIYYAAIDLQTQIKEMIALLRDKELRAAFGARDMWGVIDQIAQTELGGARNSSKYRALATSGAIITTWLADNLDRIRHPTDPIISLPEVENPPARASGQSSTRNPTDYDLVNACDLWLADSAMGEDRVDELSQPRESPQQPSRPIFIPTVARDLLEGAGLGLEMGMVNGSGRQRAGNGAAYGRYQGY